MADGTAAPAEQAETDVEHVLRLEREAELEAAAGADRAALLERAAAGWEFLRGSQGALWLLPAGLEGEVIRAVDRAVEAARELDGPAAAARVRCRTTGARFAAWRAKGERLDDDAAALADRAERAGFGPEPPWVAQVEAEPAAPFDGDAPGPDLGEVLAEWDGPIRSRRWYAFNDGCSVVEKITGAAGGPEDGRREYRLYDRLPPAEFTALARPEAMRMS